VIYRLLGELEIGRDGDLLELPGGLTQILLAVLLINVNRRMSKSELIRAAWGSDDVREAQLHKRISAVRDLLARIGRRDDLKTHSGFGYELYAETEDVDALLFQHMVGTAEQARAERRAEDETACLWRALRLWRGAHALSDVPGDAFRKEITGLEQRRKRAAARLFDLEIVYRNYEHALDELILIAGFYPSDRRLCEQLMLTQYRCGHLADAAGAYQRYRDALAEESGGVPDPLLRNLHYAMAREDDAAITAAESVVAKRAGIALRLAAAVPRQLPRPVHLFGRDDLVAEVSWLLRREPRSVVPVVVISGPGGIGKTALAVRAAHDSCDHFPDGQLYLELQGTTGGRLDTSEALEQCLRALGVSHLPKEKAERLATYRTLLADRRVLVVLDDAADGAQVTDLLPASLGCAVVVTARQRLPEVSDTHHVVRLEPLDRVDATEFFLRVVDDAGVSLEDDLDAVGDVVTLCGGLPLALRIAGALRVHDDSRPTAELADRLARQGPEGFTYRELNVARTIGAGFEHLSPDARQLFLGLGLLPLPAFGFWTAAALLDQAGTDSLAALSELAASFIVDPVKLQGRYRFHDLTREYARRRALAEYRGDRDTACEQVYRALLTLVRHAHTRLYGNDFDVVHSEVLPWAAPPAALAEIDAAPLDWFEKERPNIRVAVEHCAELGLTGICWDLAVSSHEFYTLGGYLDDWHATHTVALDACRRAVDRHGEGIVLVCLNQPALAASRPATSDTTVADLQRAADLLARCGDRHGQAIALRTLGNALRRQGHIAQAIALFDEAVRYYSESGDVVGRWQTLRYIGQTLLDRGGYEEAQQVLGQAQSLASELGSSRLIAQTQYWIGQGCLATGDLDGAQSAFDAVFDVYRDDTSIAHGYAVHGLGDLACCRGSYGAAERHLAVAGDLARDGEDAVLEGRVWLSAAALHQAQRQLDDQVAALQQAVTVFAGCGTTYLEVRALAELSEVMMCREDAAAAEAAWARVERLWDAAGVQAEDRIHRHPAAE
jgi:DNA-binding SARP family transcriptional activator